VRSLRSLLGIRARYTGNLAYDVSADGQRFLKAPAKRAEKPPPFYHRLTFRRGTIYGARFAPNGQTVVYTAAWDGQPPKIFATRLGSVESREL